MSEINIKQEQENHNGHLKLMTDSEVESVYVKSELSMDDSDDEDINIKTEAIPENESVNDELSDNESNQSSKNSVKSKNWLTVEGTNMSCYLDEEESNDDINPISYLSTAIDASEEELTSVENGSSIARTRGSKRVFDGNIKTILSTPLYSSDIKPTLPHERFVLSPSVSTELQQLTEDNTLLDSLHMPENLKRTVYSPPKYKVIVTENTAAQSEDSFSSEHSCTDSGSEDDDMLTDTLGVTQVQLTDKQWTKDRPLKNKLPYEIQSGLTITLDGSQPIDVFKAVFDESMLELIVNATNKFGDELKQQSATPNARMKTWKPLSVKEFRTWLGLLYHMGIISLSRLRDYWNTDQLFNIPVFRNCMSRDRFCNILQSLNFCSNQPAQTDRLSKIQPLLNQFHKTMDEIYKPIRNLCIDDPILLWHGEFASPVLLKEDRHKYGIKLSMLTEPTGLVLHIVVYTGVSDRVVGGRGYVEKVVYKLLEGKLNCGHSLFTESYYNSVKLVHQLLEKRTYVTGELKTDHKENPPAIQTKLNESDIIKLFSEDSVCILKWRNRQDILMISSEFGADMVNTTNCRGVIMSKPEAVVKHNEMMRVFDRAGQMMAYYPMKKKPLKWYKKLAIHVFHLALLNSYILFQKCFPKSKMSLYDFRLSVIKALILPSYNPKHIPTAFPRPAGKEILHLPVQHITKDGQTRKVRKRCRMCYSKKIRKDTTYYCPLCPDLPSLCLKNCFQEFHKK